MDAILDKIVARYGFSIYDELSKEDTKPDYKELEREINKALGILIKDGLFAYAIWLKSENKKPHRLMQKVSLELLKNEELCNSNCNDLISCVEMITENIEKTLLARQLLERMLVYARYRAKALQKGE